MPGGRVGSGPEPPFTGCSVAAPQCQKDYALEGNSPPYNIPAE